ncbi:unnamed protein product [Aphanomyces euteiches]|uniref:Uncharacterized protein n=1 Tax=Aphanomyces euteiches TaxID=100861 RepID=A0A6G0W7X7_9STRA|nr:hypothetical protein Ae201684_017711 [Aphanomyces euteiches]KAH9095506.1 hypothetical protein Ae201684P_014572 [Aphanomyces euteiches]KAH9154707.1 hypothetical protein AeRB84_003247 [Aphanomyces euteiches]
MDPTRSHARKPSGGSSSNGSWVHLSDSSDDSQQTALKQWQDDHLLIVPEYTLFAAGEGSANVSVDVLKQWIHAKGVQLRLMKQRGASEDAVLQQVRVLLSWTKRLRALEA